MIEQKLNSAASPVPSVSVPLPSASTPYGQGIGMPEDKAPPAPPPQIQYSLTLLEQTTDTLENLIAKLLIRLTPIVEPKVDTPAAFDHPDTNGAPLAAQIMKVNYRLAYMNDIIKEVTQTLEI